MRLTRLIQPTQKAARLISGVLPVNLKSDSMIDAQASIDDPAIVANIIELMEGGREAFERRQKKYGITAEMKNRVG